MAEGDIGSVIDTFEFDPANCAFPEMCHVSGDIYAIVYQGPDDDGFLITVSIDSSGNIGAAVIDTWEFSGTTCIEPQIYHVSGSVFVVVYEWTGSDGVVWTVNISAAGTITKSTIDILIFETVQCKMPKMIKVSSSCWAIVFSSSLDDGFCKTVGLNSAGVIGAAPIDTFEFAPTNGIGPDIIHVSGDVFAVVYRGPDDDGWVCTFTIDISGNIGAAVIDTLEFDASFCYQPEIRHVADDIFAVAYQGPDADGFLCTFSIDSAGNIGASVIDTFEFDTATGQLVSILLISRNMFAIAYQGPDGDGWVKTINIASNGDIAAAITDSEEFDTSYGMYPALIHVAGDVHAIAYRGVDNDGFLCTLGIEKHVPGGAQHLLLMGIG